MYYRRNRFSFYLTWGLFWLRVRDKAGMPRGILFRVGRET